MNGRIGGETRYILTEAEEPLVTIPDKIRKCVAFLGYRDTGGSIHLAGTAFFVFRQVPGEPDLMSQYVVTAKHVIDNIRTKSGDGYALLRMNVRDGVAQWFDIEIDTWVVHPDDYSAVDVAIRSLPILEEADHLAYPITSFATPEHIAKYKIGVGEDVFLPGLFVHHFGRDRNIPIIRAGNIAAMPEEPVSTNLGLMEAYLIEARSIGGLSGSPVFVYLGALRHIEGDLKVNIRTAYGAFLLLGLMHGHWDVSDLSSLPDEQATDRAINTGIGIVVPAGKILEAIDQPMMKAELERELKKFRRRGRPSMDSLMDSLKEESSPLTKGDF